MATTPTFDINSISPEKLAEILEQLRQEDNNNAPPPPAQPQPIKISFNGVDFVGNSAEEVQRQIDVYTRALANEQHARQIQDATRQQTATPAPKEPKSKKTTEEWVNKFTEDPVEVMEQEIRSKVETYMAEKFGMPNWAEVQRAAVQQIVQDNLQKTKNAFFERNPDFVEDPVNLQAIQGIMQQNGLQPSLQGLEWAWSEAKRQQVARVKQAEPVARPTAPLPMLPTGGANPGSDLLDAFYSTTDPVKQEQILRLIEKAQAG
jgi:hypothetical protein